MSLSISHRSDRAFCALSSTLPPAIGADLERVESRDPAFVHDFFTVDEDRRVWACPPSRQDTLITVIWSAKESVLKALRHGLRVDTRSIEIFHVAGLEGAQAAMNKPPEQTWYEVQIRCTLPDSGSLHGWWQPWEDHVLTIATRE
jgi:4'-phosphopantetheinyl transferase